MALGKFPLSQKERKSVSRSEYHHLNEYWRITDTHQELYLLNPSPISSAIWKGRLCISKKHSINLHNFFPLKRLCILKIALCSHSLYFSIQHEEYNRQQLQTGAPPRKLTSKQNFFSCKDRISAVGRGWRKFVLPSNQASCPRPHPLLTARGPEHQEPLEPTGAKELFLSRGECPVSISFVVTGFLFVCVLCVCFLNFQ